MSKDDGWIKHEAGPCPVPPETYVDVRMRDGVECENHRADGWGVINSLADWWKHEGDPTNNIVAYRVVETKTGNDE